MRLNKIPKGTIFLMVLKLLCNFFSVFVAHKALLKRIWQDFLLFGLKKNWSVKVSVIFFADFSFMYVFAVNGIRKNYKNRKIRSLQQLLLGGFVLNFLAHVIDKRFRCNAI